MCHLQVVEKQWLMCQKQHGKPYQPVGRSLMYSGGTWGLASHLVLLIVVDVAVAGGITRSLAEVVVGGFHQQVRLWLNMRPVARQLAGGRGGQATPCTGGEKERPQWNKAMFVCRVEKKHCGVDYKTRHRSEGEIFQGVHGENKAITAT